eukprot:7676808-Pyramimonas_sp.AAC.1
MHSLCYDAVVLGPCQHTRRACVGGAPGGEVRRSMPSQMPAPEDLLQPRRLGQRPRSRWLLERRYPRPL